MEVRNRFKGLDLIDRVPDELWNEVRDIVQQEYWSGLLFSPLVGHILSELSTMTDRVAIF